MRVHLVWKDDTENADGSGAALGSASPSGSFCWLVWSRWIFLFGRTPASMLSQAYQDWAFDETLRGLKPSVHGFVHDEISSLVGTRSKPENPPENPDAPRKFEATPKDRAPLPTCCWAGCEFHGCTSLGWCGKERTREPCEPRSATFRERRCRASIGNIGLAGHRDTFFRALRNIEKDDTIDFETESGTYRYAVESTKNCFAARCQRSESGGRTHAHASNLLPVLLRRVGA